MAPLIAYTYKKILDNSNWPVFFYGNKKMQQRHRSSELC